MLCILKSVDFLDGVVPYELDFGNDILIGGEFLVFFVEGFEVFARRIPLKDAFFVLDIIEAFGGIVGTGGESHRGVSLKL
jgi:hypothetical protein